jgi:NTP pyrophosphatase (non-canonical NTP hydrolase)
MSDIKDHGFTGGVHTSVLNELNLFKAEEQLVAQWAPDLTPEDQQEIVNTPFDQMVTNLAKPGQTMKDELKFIGFLKVLQVCAAVINRGNELDTVKKAVVYNKAVDAPAPFTLPSSQGLAEAFEALDGEKMHLLHMALGLAGEAAEMLDQVVSHVLGAPLDGKNVREEAGDASFYIVGLLNGIQTPLAEALLANKVKLMGYRYKKGYSDKAAQERADKPAGE